MNGNVTEEGVRKDIEWFNRIGLGGFHLFDANINTPQIVEERLGYMNDDWKEIFKMSIEMADSLGMDVTIPSSPGFSSTGGPWISPDKAMRKVTWREMEIEGGRQYADTLPTPFFYTGKFQDWGVKEKDLDNKEGTFYEDIAVIAVKLPDTYKTLKELGAEISSSGGEFTLEQLTNGRYSDKRPIPAGENGYSWIQYSFPEPQTIKALTVISEHTRNPRHSVPAFCHDSLQVSDDGVNFRTVLGIPVGDANRQTISFEGITARHFRLKHRNPKSVFHYTMINRAPDPKFSEIAEFVLYPELRINMVEGKAAYTGFHDLRLNPTIDAGAEDILTESIDITSYYKDGILTWDVPEGRWRIFRFGSSLTGKLNHPASPEATGLEVDKLDPEAWDEHFRVYLQMNKEAADGMLGERGIRNVLIDSYEAELQNWTPKMREEFTKRRGYDPFQWLPVLTGAIVNSTQESEQFLFDWRKTINELFCENYNRVTDLIQKEFGMKGCFIEAHASGTVFPMDGMDMKKNAAYPMGEIWIQGPVGTDDRIPEARADIKESSSAAHIYGHNLTAAESFTAIGLGKQAYTFHPGNLKKYADIAMASGVNLFVIHDSAHQPLDTHKPGLGLGVFGQWFNRHETWAESAGEWINYLARSCYMLQQGRGGADVLWYYGEDTNITALYSHSYPGIPEGYDLDFINPAGLLNDVYPEDGKLKTKSGMSYSVLCLDPSITKMSTEIAERIEFLKENGIKVCREEELKDVLEQVCAPDMLHNCSTSLNFVHRILPDGHIWWVNSPALSKTSAEVSFRVSGLKPQKWDPVTGKICDISYTMKDGRTFLNLDFEPEDSYFIVFRGETKKEKAVAREYSVEKEVAEIQMDGLGLWNETEEWKHFSGTREFTCKVEIPKFSGRLILDLGEVYNIAEVEINGKKVATLWKTPFKTDISEHVKKGESAEIKIKVTNLWVNRLIGDAGLPVEERSTYTHLKFYEADDALLPSGIAGPVRLLESKPSRR